MHESPHAVTGLLKRGREGDPKAISELLPLVYDQLRSLADKYMRSERQGHTLQATALVHEAYMRLAGADVDYENRVHFFAVAAGVMRRILVDHAKSRGRQKRGAGAAKVTLNEAVHVGSDPDSAIADIDEALTILAKVDERKARIVELIYFGGLTYDETASAVGVSAVTVHRELKFARAWLQQQMAGGA
ncbi:MAG: sigma-70 family RNA polymerase sigma factor [Bryobacteraceae bacterium]